MKRVNTQLYALTRKFHEDRQPFCRFVWENKMLPHLNIHLAKVQFVPEHFSEKSGKTGCAKSLQP
ncbi:MAG TPA: hypothetical protein EYH06_04865 [Chromatiales bacterium]|nr:hypothetical protein [Chromatiales bacterium]